MRAAQVRPDGTMIRWVELPGAEPARVYVHGLGSSSPPYYAAAATHPALAGHRSLLIDLLGFGISDRPTGFDYTLEGHADLLAEALTQANVESVDVIGHSMGGAVAILLASRHPHLVARLVLVDACLDPITPDQGTIHWKMTGRSEQEFLAEGWEQALELAGPHWAATMRLAGRQALYRSMVDLTRRGTGPTMRQILLGLPMPRTFLYPAAHGRFPGEAELLAGGIRVVAIPDCGHNIMIDNVDGFAHAVRAALPG
ncbi:MAG: alpha/beta hydrolase [Dactylosporangium sp.]|nr:alpha/beta hydrolase [Dactylosporangium sp.]NNJ60950.1 alpha/beta hydrolase [Dactylosporangium sp.]